MGSRVGRVLVAETAQAHRLLDVLEAVQVGERQAVEFPSGSAVITDQVVVEATAPHDELGMRMWNGRGTLLDEERTARRQGH